MNQSPVTTHRFASQLATFAIVAASSILFCSKGVVIKLAYAHGADAVDVLTWRMAFALPFFAVMAFRRPAGAPRLTPADWLRLAALGFVGYYVSAFVNFTGLQYVSVGLERIVLYTYPSMVLALSAFVFRKPVSRSMWLACAVAWLGVVAAFAGESHAPAKDERIVPGTALILASALTYAVFILFSGGIVRRVGAMRFTGIAVGWSCVFMLAHALVVRPAGEFFELPGAVYRECVILALFGTVAPSLLLAIGLRRTGAQQFAVIGTVGPITTLFLAWLVLGEQPNAGQAVGFALAICGGLAVSLRKENG